MKRVFVMLVGSCLALAGVLGNAVAVANNPAVSSNFYSFETPDSSLRGSFEKEFQIRLPASSIIERFTWDSSSKNIITLTFSGRFDTDEFFREGLLCKKGLCKSHTESEMYTTEVFTIYGYTNYENDYAQMTVSWDKSDGEVQITMSKRGIRDIRLRQRVLDRQIGIGQ